MLKGISRSIGILVLGLVAMPAMSVIVHMEGATVDFYYDDADIDMAAFGTLSNIGDSIFATPTDFLAESLNGGSDIFSAMGTVQVVAKTGYRFNALQVAQQGDYQLTGTNTNVSVSSISELTVEDSFNNSINSTMALNSSSDFSIANGLANPWSSSVVFDLDTSYWSNTSSIDLSLDSVLNASTAINGDIAFIQNKFVGGGLVTIETTPVPLPAALWLMISGLLVFAGLAKRHR